MQTPATQEMAVEETDSMSAREDRRSFLRKAGIGSAAAGAVWVAPAILTLDAARACGTCANPTGITSWAAAGCDVATNAATCTSFTHDGVLVTITGVDTGGEAVNRNFRATNRAGDGDAVTTFGTFTDWYQMRMNATAQNSDMSVTFDFFDEATPTQRVTVSNFCLVLIDIDERSAASGWTDRVWLEAFDANANATDDFSFTRGDAPPVNPSGSGTSAAPWIGEESVLNDSVDGNVTPLYATPVQRIRVRYQNQSGGFTGSVQRIGIRDLNWCAGSANNVNSPVPSGVTVGGPSPFYGGVVPEADPPPYDPLLMD